jgi:thiol-disulfide isomerase/thioredoxin
MRLLVAPVNKKRESFMTHHQAKDTREEISEKKLNVPPPRFFVSVFVKKCFCALAFVLLGGFVWMSLNHRATQNTLMMENQLQAELLTDKWASPLELNDLSTGQAVNFLPPHRGFVLLNFFATWCPSCLEEMPSLELLNQSLKERLSVIAISLDDDPEKVKSFITSHKPEFLVWWDSSKKSQELYDVRKFPETYLISPEGKLLAFFAGPRDWSSPGAISYLKKLMAL